MTFPFIFLGKAEGGDTGEETEEGGLIIPDTIPETAQFIQDLPEETFLGEDGTATLTCVGLPIHSIFIRCSVAVDQNLVVEESKKLDHCKAVLSLPLSMHVNTD